MKVRKENIKKTGKNKLNFQNEREMYLFIEKKRF